MLVKMECHSKLNVTQIGMSQKKFFSFFTFVLFSGPLCGAGHPNVERSPSENREACTVVFGTNTVVFLTNTVVFGTNTVVSWTNTVVFWTNTVVFGTNTAIFGTN